MMAILTGGELQDRIMAVSDRDDGLHTCSEFEVTYSIKLFRLFPYFIIVYVGIRRTARVTKCIGET